jgi:hypothetical protein
MKEKQPSETAAEGAEAAKRHLNVIWTVREPAGVERPTKIEITQPTFVRDPRVRAWGLATARRLCEGCANQAPFFTDDGSPFLEVHHVKTLSDWRFRQNHKCGSTLPQLPPSPSSFGRSSFLFGKHISTSSAPDPGMITPIETWGTRWPLLDLALDRRTDGAPWKERALPVGGS